MEICDMLWEMDWFVKNTTYKQEFAHPTQTARKQVDHLSLSTAAKISALQIGRKQLSDVPYALISRFAKYFE